jgi:mono/diheme cytochrome c family protein
MNGWNRMLAVTGLVALGGLAACGGTTPGTSTSDAAAAPAVDADAAVAITPAAREQAQQIFATRCTACHGPEGRGDGPGAAAMDPKPRNYHDAEWQRTVTDKEIEAAIVYGGSAVGRSPLMVANPDLGSKPAVVSALREIVRNFGKTR